MIAKPLTHDERRMRKLRLAAKRNIWAYNDRKNGRKPWKANRRPRWQETADTLLLVALWAAFVAIVLTVASN